MPVSPALAASAPDYRLTIGRASVEIAPGHVTETVGYNGQIPGPLIWVREGQQTRIEVSNHSANHDLLHWHGLAIPSVMDGAMEEESPMITPTTTFTYAFEVDFTANDPGPSLLHCHM